VSKASPHLTVVELWQHRCSSVGSSRTITRWYRFFKLGNVEWEFGQLVSLRRAAAVTVWEFSAVLAMDALRAPEVGAGGVGVGPGWY